MKARFLAGLMGLAMLFSVSTNAHAFIFNNWFFSVPTCTTYQEQTPRPAAWKAFCLDDITGTFYVWNGTAFVAPIFVSSGTTLTGGAPFSSDGGTAPTLTAGCTAGGGSGVVGTNVAGTITTGASAATTCTMTFNVATAFAVAPTCLFTDGNASVTPVAYSTGAASTTTVVVDFASASSKVIKYICIGG